VSNTENENSLRDLLGYGGPPEIIFMGKKFEIRPDGLVPLLRYAGSGPAEEEQLKITQQDEDQRALASAHHLLEDCVVNFGSFSELAMKTKADMNEINEAVVRLVRYYTCRSHWSALRLLRTLASALDEIDGQLLRSSGRGIAGLTPREACNLMMAICLENREEEDRITFLEDLEFEGNAESEALALARKMMTERLENDGGT
jgi:hypothetical protein